MALLCFPVRNPTKGHPPTALGSAKRTAYIDYLPLVVVSKNAHSSLPMVPFGGSQDDLVGANDVLTNINHFDNSLYHHKSFQRARHGLLESLDYLMCPGDDRVPPSTVLNFSWVLIDSAVDSPDSHQPSF
ncbi:hypothetical protein F4804DRAFT_333171 [Jackrogersella minutella]|nr:hypothetical protein F4804DRAFT_333171 [Jackrogersella minutella]